MHLPWEVGTRGAAQAVRTFAAHCVNHVAIRKQSAKIAPFVEKKPRKPHFHSPETLPSTKKPELSAFNPFKISAASIERKIDAVSGA